MCGSIYLLHEATFQSHVLNLTYQRMQSDNFNRQKGKARVKYKNPGTINLSYVHSLEVEFDMIYKE